MKKMLWAALFIAIPASMAAKGKPVASRVEPDCKPINTEPSLWSIAFCKKTEKDSHYPTEMRFILNGKLIFKYVYLSDPTGGYPEGDILAATDRYILIEVPGDEANQLLGFNLEKKNLVFNTGHVVGMKKCTLDARTSNDRFCRVSVACPVGPNEESSKNYRANISEFFCPESAAPTQ